VSKADVLRVDAQVAGAEVLLARAQAQETVLEEQLRIADCTRARAATPSRFRRRPDAAAGGLSSLPRSSKLAEAARAKRLEVKALEKTLGALGGQASAGTLGLPAAPRRGRETRRTRTRTSASSSQRPFDATWDVGVQLTYSPNEVSARHPGGPTPPWRRGAEAEAQRDQFLDCAAHGAGAGRRGGARADTSVDATRRASRRRRVVPRAERAVHQRALDQHRAHRCRDEPHPGAAQRRRCPHRISGSPARGSSTRPERTWKLRERVHCWPCPGVPRVLEA